MEAIGEGSIISKERENTLPIQAKRISEEALYNLIFEKGTKKLPILDISPESYQISHNIAVKNLGAGPCTEYYIFDAETGTMISEKYVQTS